MATDTALTCARIKAISVRREMCKNIHQCKVTWVPSALEYVNKSCKSLSHTTTSFYGYFEGRYAL